MGPWYLIQLVVEGSPVVVGIPWDLLQLVVEGPLVGLPYS